MQLYPTILYLIESYSFSECNETICECHLVMAILAAVPSPSALLPGTHAVTVPQIVDELPNQNKHATRW